MPIVMVTNFLGYSDYFIFMVSMIITTPERPACQDLAARWGRSHAPPPLPQQGLEGPILGLGLGCKFRV